MNNIDINFNPYHIYGWQRGFRILDSLSLPERYKDFDDFFKHEEGFLDGFNYNIERGYSDHYRRKMKFLLHLYAYEKYGEISPIKKGGEFGIFECLNCWYEHGYGNQTPYYKWVLGL